MDKFKNSVKIKIKEFGTRLYWGTFSLVWTRSQIFVLDDFVRFRKGKQYELYESGRTLNLFQ